MAAQLHLQSVITPTQKETVKEVESYIQKPLVIETFITVDTPPEPRYKPPQGDVIVIGQNYDQCVVWARKVTGNDKIHGYAGNLKPEGQEPKIGAIALEGSAGHVSVITDIMPDGKLVLEDANYKRGYITKRIVSPESQRGYIY